MISTATTVTTTPQRILAKSNSFRTVYVHVIGVGVVYLGGSDVTSTNGLLTEKNAVPLVLDIPAQEELWAVTGSGTESLRLLTPGLYNQ
jgi:hypothetical protein